MMICVSDWVENIVGKGENAGYQHFLLLPSMFSKDFLPRIVKKSGLCGKELTHYQTTTFRLFQTERVSDNKFKFNENGRKLSKWVENTAGKGEIAHYETFFLFPQRFQKACFPGASKGVIAWEWVKQCFLLLIQLILPFLPLFICRLQMPSISGKHFFVRQPTC